MHIVDFHPARGCFTPGQTVSLLLAIESAQEAEATARLHIRHLVDEARMVEEPLNLIPGSQTIRLDWMPPAQPGGYAARVELIAPDGGIVSRASTAFDILDHWTDFPRYGFLSDFGADRLDPDLTLDQLVRFHINGLQFYDWQYRHEQLVAPTDDYLDPLGRPMSLGIVRKLVDSAHAHGMAALPYLAVYAASVAFWRAHPGWELYDEDGQPIPFGENFLGLMNPSANSPWIRHLLSECNEVLQSIPFDGLHIDQYGKPKCAWDANREPVDLPRAFVDFIQAARRQHPDRIILFNAVENWPIEALATAPLDFLYIEPWPPDVKYRDLARIVLEGVRLSYGKPVVIALYLPSAHPENIQLANALILSCGGTRIELGERARLLADAYFPKHQHIAPDLLIALRRFYDFVVRNGEWLRPYNLTVSQREQWAEGELNSDIVQVSSSVWFVARRHARSLVIHFVNFTGLTVDSRWDEPHPSPGACQDVPVRVQTARRPDSLYWDCPEQSDGPQHLDFEFLDGELHFVIPQINYVGLVYIDE